MIDLEVLYEDNHCLAVQKPAGLLSQGDRTGEPSLVDAGVALLEDAVREGRQRVSWACYIASTGRHRE